LALHSSIITGDARGFRHPGLFPRWIVHWDDEIVIHSIAHHLSHRPVHYLAIYHFWTAIFYKQSQFARQYVYHRQPAVVVHPAHGGRRGWSRHNPPACRPGYTARMLNILAQTRQPCISSTLLFLVMRSLHVGIECGGIYVRCGVQSRKPANFTPYKFIPAVQVKRSARNTGRNERRVH
jgi:hypothetical protein